MQLAIAEEKAALETLGPDALAAVFFFPSANFFLA